MHTCEEADDGECDEGGVLADRVHAHVDGDEDESEAHADQTDGDHRLRRLEPVCNKRETCFRNNSTTGYEINRAFNYAFSAKYFVEHNRMGAKTNHYTSQFVWATGHLIGLRT
jgi:hypothetical protein